MTILLLDTFNHYTISRHRTLKNAVIASRKHDRAVKRCNGASSYIPYGYQYADGSAVDGDEIMAAKMAVDCNH
jgi:hypothetical protein